MKVSLILAVLAVGGTGAAYGVRFLTDSRERETFPTEALYTVHREKLTVTITESGTLMAKNSQKVSGRSRRSGKISYLIEEGTIVEKGEVLCRLETTELESQLDQLLLDINQTGADLDTAKTEVAIQISENTANVEKSELSLTKANNELEKYSEGDAVKEERKLVVGIDKAKATLAKAAEDYKASLALKDQGFITEATFYDSEMKFETSGVDLETAELDLAIWEKYTHPMAIADKEIAVKDARRTLQNASKRAESTLRQKEVAVESQQRRLARLDQQREQVEEEIENFTIRSPGPGIVLFGDPSRPYIIFGDSMQVGSTISGSRTLFTIPDLREMQVQVQIHEADIDMVKVGQSATVTMDTYPGLAIKGKITRVATVAGSGLPFGLSSAEVKKFSVDIVLESTPGQTLRPGISAKAEIFIEELNDVLFVPIQSVFMEEGQHYTYAMRETGPAKIAVEPGISNENYVQILSGIAKGDRVLLYNPAIGTGTESDTTKQSAPLAETVSATPPATMGG